MSKLRLSWSTSPKGGSIEPTCWNDVLIRLDSLLKTGGTVTIDQLDDENYLISEIQTRAEKGMYLVTFLNEDDEVMTIMDSSQPDEMVLIHGDYWPARQTTKDFDLVVKVFKEFFDTGSVSKDILN